MPDTGVPSQLEEEEEEEGSSDEERQPRAYVPPRMVAMPYGEQKPDQLGHSSTPGSTGGLPSASLCLR